MLFTRRSRRSPTERRLLAAANLYHSTRLAMLAAGAQLLFLAALQWLGELGARAAVSSLGNAEARSLPRALENLRPYRRWADPLLKKMVADQYDCHTADECARLALLAGRCHASCSVCSVPSSKTIQTISWRSEMP